MAYIPVAQRQKSAAPPITAQPLPPKTPPAGGGYIPVAQRAGIVKNETEAKPAGALKIPTGKEGPILSPLLEHRLVRARQEEIEAERVAAVKAASPIQEANRMIRNKAGVIDPFSFVYKSILIPALSKIDTSNGISPTELAKNIGFEEKPRLEIKMGERVSPGPLTPAGEAERLAELKKEKLKPTAPSMAPGLIKLAEELSPQASLERINTARVTSQYYQNEAKKRELTFNEKQELAFANITPALEAVGWFPFGTIEKMGAEVAISKLAPRAQEILRAAGVTGEIIEKKQMAKILIDAATKESRQQVLHFDKIISESQPLFRKPLESEIKNIFQTQRSKAYEVTGKYQIPESPISKEAGAIQFIDENKDTKFYSRALGDYFGVDETTKKHFFEKMRNPADAARRAKLLGSGVEIAENSPLLAAVDTQSGKAEGIIYHEILGTDTKNFPGKIINVKISEVRKEGKVLFTVTDINELKKEALPTPLSKGGTVVQAPLAKQPTRVVQPEPSGGIASYKTTIPQAEKVVKGRPSRGLGMTGAEEIRPETAKDFAKNVKASLEKAGIRFDERALTKVNEAKKEIDIARLENQIKAEKAVAEREIKLKKLQKDIITNEKEYSAALSELEGLETAIREHPALPLQKYMTTRGEFAGQLGEVLGEEKAGTWKRMGDQIIQELGYTDVEVARKEFEELRKIMERAKKLKKEISLFRSEFQEAVGLTRGAVRDEMTHIREIVKAKGLSQETLKRTKEQFGIKELKNADIENLYKLADRLGEMEEGAAYLSRAQVESLKEFGITPWTTKKEAAEILGDINSWQKAHIPLFQSFRTMERNIEFTAGKDAERILDIISRPRNKAVTEMFKEEIALKTEMQETLSKLGVLKNKDYRALIMRYGEKRMKQQLIEEAWGKKLFKYRNVKEGSEEFNKLPPKVQDEIKQALDRVRTKGAELAMETEETLLQKAAPKKWKEIQEADKWFRAKYDKLLEEVNAVLVKFNKKPIAKRNDYYTHFREIASLWDEFASSGDINPALEGISEFTRPNAKWNPFALAREGGMRFEEDAVKAFEAYLKPTLNNKYLTEHIVRHRAAADILAYNTTKTRNVNQFIKSLRVAADKLAGKTNPWDRAIMEHAIGRAGLRVIRWADRKMAVNRIIGSVSSAIMQTAGIPSSVLKNGSIDTARGLLSQAFKYRLGENDPSKLSEFLLRRYGQRETIVPTLTQRAGFAAAIPFELIERNVTESIWRASFTNAYRQGYKGDILITKADEICASVVGARAPGEKALAFESGLAALPLRFQLEVNTFAQLVKTEVINKLGPGAILKDPKMAAKAVERAVETAITLFLFNTFYQAAFGRTPLPDPIRAVKEAWGEDDWYMKLGRLAGEGLSGMPGGSFVASFVPQETRKKIFGRTEVGIYQGGVPVASAWSNILGNLFKGRITKAGAGIIYDFVLPFGGAQLKRIMEGLGAIDKLGSYDANGQLKFPIARWDLPKVFLFGQYSTKEARDFFEKKHYGIARTKLSEKQTLEYFIRTQKGENPKTVFDDITKERRAKEQRSVLADALIDKIKQNPTHGFAIYTLWAKQGIIDADMRDYIFEKLGIKSEKEEAKEKVLKGLAD